MSEELKGPLPNVCFRELINRLENRDAEIFFNLNAVINPSMIIESPEVAYSDLKELITLVINTDNSLKDVEITLSLKDEKIILELILTNNKVHVDFKIFNFPSSQLSLWDMNELIGLLPKTKILNSLAIRNMSDTYEFVRMGTQFTNELLKKYGGQIKDLEIDFKQFRNDYHEPLPMQDEI